MHTERTDDDDACFAHALEKLCGYERKLGHDVSHLELEIDRLYGDRTPDPERTRAIARRRYAAAQRAEEMKPFVEAITTTYPQIKVSLQWSRKHGRKTELKLSGCGSFGPTYVSSERYGAGDPDDLLAKLPEIVTSLHRQRDARTAIDEMIASGKIRQQGGCVLIPGHESHPCYKTKFRGVILCMAYASCETTLKTIRELTDGQ